MSLRLASLTIESSSTCIGSTKASVPKSSSPVRRRASSVKASNASAGVAATASSMSGRRAGTETGQLHHPAARLRIAGGADPAQQHRAAFMMVGVDEIPDAGVLVGDHDHDAAVRIVFGAVLVHPYRQPAIFQRFHPVIVELEVPENAL